MPARRTAAALPALALTLVAAPPLARAQETAPLVLRLPASPRAFGLGDAFVGGRGPDVAFYNPARVGLANGLFAAVSRYRSAATQAAVASSTSVGPVGLAVAALWLDYGASAGVFPTAPSSLTTRGTDPSQSLAAVLAAGAAFRGFRWGAALKYLEERLPDGRGSIAAFDLGLSREVARVSLGLVLQHLGADLEVAAARAELPRRLVLGAASPRVPLGTWFDLQATADLAWERDGRVVPGGGVELIYIPVEGWSAAVRVGARRTEPAAERGQRPFTVGASFGLDRFAIDYGFESHRGGGGAHRLGLRLQ